MMSMKLGQDWTTLKSLWFLFSFRDRLFIGYASLIKVLLVILDIAGLALLGSAVSLISGAQIAPNSLTSKVFDWLAAHGVAEVSQTIAAVSVAFFVIKGILSVVTSSYIGKQGAKIETQMASELFEDFSRANLDQRGSMSPEQVTYALTDSTGYGSGKYIFAVSVIAGELFLIASLFTFLIVVNAFLAILTVLYFGIFGLAMYFTLGVKNELATNRKQVATVESSSVLRAYLSIVKQIFPLNSVNSFQVNFSKWRREMSEANVSLSLISILPRYITEIALILGICGLAIFSSGKSDIPGSQSTVAIFVAASFRLVASMLPLQGMFGLMRQISVEIQPFIHLKMHLQRENPTIETFRTESIAVLNPKLVIKSMTYKYPGSETLLKFPDLEIDFKERVTIVGPSGSGKSTFADLLIGLRNPHSGQMHVSGDDGMNIDVSYRKIFAYVPQHIQLIPGTVYDNVALGVPSNLIDHKLVASCIELVQLDEVFASLEKGLHSRLDSHMANLSGGQIQRIGVARALYLQPKILILDESTSALDPILDLQIEKVLADLNKSMTIISISHKEKSKYNFGRTIRFG